MFWLILLAAGALSAQTDPASISRGGQTFATSCTESACHGTGGAAGKAPRLLSRSLSRERLGRVIRDGIPNTTMPGFQSRLKEPEIEDLVDYVVSLNQEPAEASASKPAGFEGPEQARRGRAQFFEADGPARCGTCHRIARQGTAVGPDLARLARLSPRALVTAILASRTQYVVELKLRDNTSFPAMKVSQDSQAMEVFDLSATPPVSRRVNRTEVAAMVDNVNWKHPPGAAGLTSEQLADIIAYIRFAAYGDKAGVKLADVE
ncbi:MAG: c-type cytochrome [Acidobacteria bacterium]|nr:c-type cytochrome [Acidobacteriota bacterium]